MHLKLIKGTVCGFGEEILIGREKTLLSFLTVFKRAILPDCIFLASNSVLGSYPVWGQLVLSVEERYSSSKYFWDPHLVNMKEELSTTCDPLYWTV